MSDEKFDKEISLLYQQRKQEIAAPEINLPPTNARIKKRYNALQVLSILFFGSAASFGILAVISHLSVKKMTKPDSSTGIPLTVVELAELPESSEDVVIVVQAPLAPGKPAVIPPKLEQEKVVKVQKLKTNLTVLLPIDVVNIMPSPSIVQPRLSLVPIYQVLPKYSLKASASDQEGKVTLSYGITPKGKVHSIVIDESNVNRELNRAAKRALSKWRYQADEYEQNRYEIIFDFMLNEKK
jgi:protein TonB